VVFEECPRCEVVALHDGELETLVQLVQDT